MQPHSVKYFSHLLALPGLVEWISEAALETCRYAVVDDHIVQCATITHDERATTATKQ